MHKRLRTFLTTLVLLLPLAGAAFLSVGWSIPADAQAAPLVKYTVVGTDFTVQNLAPPGTATPITTPTT